MSTADMRHAYEQWCFSEGEPPIPANVFGREIKARGAGITKSNGRRFYTNVTLMRPEDSIAPEPRAAPLWRLTGSAGSAAGWHENDPTLWKVQVNPQTGTAGTAI
jgi:hypothetical protein